MSTLLTEANALLPQLQELRRRLHAHPEVGLDLPRTQAAVLTALGGLDLEVSTGVETTSVVAVLRGTHPDKPAHAPAVLLRGDMDALPIEELTDEPFKSTNKNMHACGHDLHTAGLVGAVQVLHQHREDLAGDVVFMFQPGEEGHNGASVMINEGVLDAAGPRVIAAFGAHVNMDYRGLVSTKPGTLQAGSNVLHITLHGRGGHGSQPQSAIDPVPALAELVTALQNMVSRRINTFDPIALSVTQLKAGEAINVIPASATLGATVRTLSQESLDIVRTQSKQLAKGIAEAHGCTAEVDFQVQYPVTVNDEAETAWTLAQVRSLLGADRVEVSPHPIMPSEDFSFVLHEVPGTYMMLGAKRTDVPEEGQGDNHSPFVIFDDTVLGDQAALLSHLALERLRTEI
ncbi:M20 metallopeptidase family protein [Brevibacterium antiquum]|uniref:Hippurate hydrolase n=1 Tax=Brevibacterium antiquum TaxID=234835 RepID=A0A2H1K6M5_9MICO|nr:M20 family metallopeptidase [Brevibacterium antiquum]SMX95198.1 hippurate hydrolase [Brevibacterium antiquum]